MATVYLDPGVYIEEVVVPSGANVNSIPLTATLIGIGNRYKRVNNEAIVRGLVSGEAISPASSSPHTVALDSISNRQSVQTTVYANGTAIDAAEVTFLAPIVTGTVLTTLDFSSNNKIALSLDGNAEVNIAIITGGADLVTVSGNTITARVSGLTLGSLTAANIVYAINLALGYDSPEVIALGYGPEYAFPHQPASVSGGRVVLTSPVNTSSSDVRLFAAFPASQTAAVFGVTLPYQAPTVIQVSDLIYNSLATYTVDYVATNTSTDTLLNSGIQSMIRVGSYAGVSTFTENYDYTRSGSTLDWDQSSSASLMSGLDTATKDTSSNNIFLLSVDGKASITITLAIGPAITNAAICLSINTALAAAYGPRYSAVATITTGAPIVNGLITLTSPNEGVGSSVEVANDDDLTPTCLTIFGLASTQLPYAVQGIGIKPVPSTVYFASYYYTRPTSDYNLPKRYFSSDQVHADVGYPTSTNQLAIASDIAFENGAPSVIIVQVNDANFPGSPTSSELLTALTATNETDTTTEICMLTTELASQVDVLNNIVNQNSPTQKNARRGWFGMPRSTQIGDKDTPETYVYRAKRTLQVPGDSPGRGRLNLVGPSDISRDITREDGSISNVLLDGSYAAVAVAARMTSFSNASDTLLRKNVSGFKLDDFQTFKKAERAILASNGVTVITNNGGNLVLMDPISTEAGGLTAFQEISASTQKDAATRAVSQITDANLIGVVPDDLAQFILTIKGYIGNALRSLISQGSIAPYKNSSGVSRDIDLSRDVQVFQSSTDQTSYSFRYTFNLRYPAKRMMGAYSVDSPFFS